ncbi:MAG TPA: signal recognition particle-docking protein FtsY [Candidatus Binataceae bacterium]|nr:signal recognition particle-docking protein FtsY [Candidatus Binataceae bacterium]
MPDYINQIPGRLSAFIARMLVGLASLEHLSPAEILARLSLVERLALVVVASQIVLFVAAMLIEFSARKRRRADELGRAAEEALRALRAEPTPAKRPPAQPAPMPAAQKAPVAQPAPAAEAAPAAPAERPAEAAPKPERVEPAKVKAEPAPAAPTVQPTAPKEAVPSPAPAPPAASAPGSAAPAKPPSRIGLGLRRTRENLLARIRAAITGSAKIDDICESLEEALIAADVGVQASLKLVEAVRSRVQDGTRPDAIRDALKDEIVRMLDAAERPLNIPGGGPLVVMLAGVNGAGKTTTVAKLAARMKTERGTVIVAASDTFRAAAIEQLEVWCGRVGAELIRQNQGSDPAAVAFDAVKAAVARNVPTVLIDTAGRLQTKVNLMEELKKIARVTGRELPGAPHECWLVLDATTGQNALSQAKIFSEAVPLTGVVLAKLDSTAKGGVVIAIAEQLKLPVRFVGVGENVEDLRAFDPREFVEALFAEDESRPEPSSGSYAA